MLAVTQMRCGPDAADNLDRAETLADSMQVLRGVAGLGGPYAAPFADADVLLNAGLGIAVLLGVQVWQERVGPLRDSLARGPMWLQWAAVYGLVFAIVLLGVEAGAQFIYFQF